MNKTPAVALTPAQQEAFDALRRGMGTPARDATHRGHLNALVRKGVAFKEHRGSRVTYYRLDAMTLHHMGF